MNGRERNVDRVQRLREPRTRVSAPVAKPEGRSGEGGRRPDGREKRSSLRCRQFDNERPRNDRSDGGDGEVDRRYGGNAARQMLQYLAFGATVVVRVRGRAGDGRHVDVPMLLTFARSGLVRLRGVRLGLIVPDHPWQRPERRPRERQERVCSERTTPALRAPGGDQAVGE